MLSHYMLLLIWGTSVVSLRATIDLGGQCCLMYSVQNCDSVLIKKLLLVLSQTCCREPSAVINLKNKNQPGRSMHTGIHSPYITDTCIYAANQQPDMLPFAFSFGLSKA